MTESTRETASSITINSIIIKKEGGKKLQIVPGPDNARIFVSLNIRENIFQNGISGSLKFKETGIYGDYFNIIGDELIVIDFESPDIEDSQHTLTFCVDDVHFLGDETIDALGGPSVRAGVGWEVNFVSCENYLLNWEELDYMDEDFIGKIAGASDWGEGFVDLMATKYFNPGANENFSFAQEDMDIENTHNSLWLKKNQNMYPWGKDVHPPNLGSLMNNLCENSVTEDLMGVNYLFYADFDGWHFKSIRQMIKDSQTYFFGWFGGPREYKITDVDSDPPDGEGDPRISSHRILNEFNHLKLWQDGAYSSYYELNKPNYDDPYFDYIDFTTQHQYSSEDEDEQVWGDREIVDYDYHRDADSWGPGKDGGRVEQFKLLPKRFDTTIDIAESNADIPQRQMKKSRRKYDESGLYGYFQSPYNYYNEKETDFLASSTFDGKHGKQNDILWQTMFDQTDLEGKYAKIIQKDIKKPTAEKYQEHIEMMNLKEKFNVYRHSICCDAQSIKKFVFLALITDAKKIQDNDRGGVYEYSWKEIEMWPTDFIRATDPEATPVETDDQAPLKIVHPKNGMFGEIRSNPGWRNEKWPDPAYNLNELMNTSDGINVYAGPGLNAADLEYNDYPEAYQMMPIGGYFEVIDDLLQDPCEMEDVVDGPIAGIQDGKWDYKTGGHIVQMYRIPNYVLGQLNEDDEVVRGGIAPMEEKPGEPDDTIPQDVYFFDVLNAHDGLCGCLS